MMRATLAWPTSVASNRPIGRGLWTWVDLVDPGDGPVVLAGTEVDGVWPLPEDRLRRVPGIGSQLRAALAATPTMVVIDESSLDAAPWLALSLAEVVAAGGSVVVGTAPEARGVRRWWSDRHMEGPPGATRPGGAATSGTAGTARLLQAVGGEIPIGSLQPVPEIADRHEPVRRSHRPGGDHHGVERDQVVGPDGPDGHSGGAGASVLLLPGGPEATGPEISRWRPRPAPGPPVAPFALLARSWTLPPRPVVEAVRVADIGREPADLATRPGVTPTGDADPTAEPGWDYAPPRGYQTQKSVFFVGTTVVKQCRHPLGASRLGAEALALDTLAGLGIGPPDPDPTSPLRQVNVGPPRLLGRADGTGGTLVCESALPGPSLRQLLHTGSPIGVAEPLMEFLVVLGRASVRPTTAEERQTAFGLVAERFARTFRLARRTSNRVTEAADQLTGLDVPSVFLHGDFTPWNVVESGTGWAIHDWENGDPEGAPLWDVAIMAAGIVGVVDGRGSPRGTAAAMFDRDGVGQVVGGWMSRYCRELSVPGEAIEPLLLTCFAHQAVKEATRLRPERTMTSRSFRMLRALARVDDLPQLTGGQVLGS